MMALSKVVIDNKPVYPHPPKKYFHSLDIHFKTLFRFVFSIIKLK